MGGVGGWPLGARLALPADGSAHEDQRGLQCLSGFSIQPRRCARGPCGWD